MKNESRLKSAGIIFGGGLAGLFALTLSAVALLSLPLSVLSTIRYTGWDWGWAVIAIFGLQFVAGLGQLVTSILGILGGYYLFISDFDWRQAAYPSDYNVASFTVSELTPEEFERYRDDTLIPSIERICKRQAKARAEEDQTLFDGKIPATLANYCECMAREFGGSVTQKEVVESEKAGTMKTILRNRGPEILNKCTPDAAK